MAPAPPRPDQYGKRTMGKNNSAHGGNVSVDSGAASGNTLYIKAAGNKSDIHVDATANTVNYIDANGDHVTIDANALAYNDIYIFAPGNSNKGDIYVDADAQAVNLIDASGNSVDINAN